MTTVVVCVVLGLLVIGWIPLSIVSAKEAYAEEQAKERAETLEAFDFHKHWAMCHNEVKVILRTGGDPKLRYIPVERWEDKGVLDAYTKHYTPVAPECPVTRALKNAQPWKLLESKDETLSWDAVRGGRRLNYWNGTPNIITAEAVRKARDAMMKL